METSKTAIKTFQLAVRYEVDLPTIIKYNQTSSFWILKSSNPKRHFTIELVMRGTYDEENDDAQVMSDYKFESIFDSLGVSKQHMANMLVMVSHIISLSWGYHNNFVEDENFETRNKVVQEYLKLIEELYILKSDFIEKSYVQISNGNNSFKVRDADEFQEILAIIIKNRLEELNDIPFKTFFNTEGIGDCSVKTLKSILDKYKSLPTDNRATLILNREISQALLSYLNGEGILLTTGDVMSQKQGVIIYTVLLIFNLIRKREAVKERDENSKAKYIYSLIAADRNPKAQKITNMEWRDIPLNDISREWHND